MESNEWESAGLKALALNDEYGMYTFGTKYLDILVNDLNAYAVQVDGEHEIYLLCDHPDTGDFGWHSLPELVDGMESTKPQEEESHILPFKPKAK